MLRLVKSEKLCFRNIKNRMQYQIASILASLIIEITVVPICMTDKSNLKLGDLVYGEELTELYTFINLINKKKTFPLHSDTFALSIEKCVIMFQVMVELS